MNPLEGNDRGLVRLLTANLRDAHALGMIECDQSEIDSHAHSLVLAAASIPDGAALQNWFSKHGHQRTVETFVRRYRPLQAFRGRHVPVANVMCLQVLKTYWLDHLDPSLSGNDDCTEAYTRISLHASSRCEATAREIQELQSDLMVLSHWMHSAGTQSCPGLSFPIGELLSKPVRPLWVGGRVHQYSESAGFWRARLGLVHLDEGRRHPGDLLVRIRGVAELTDDALSRDDHLAHRAGRADGAWMIRPCILHSNNRRFIQRVQADRQSRTARRGRTRDLKSPVYAEGERELLLLIGDCANIRLLGIDLLTGFPDRDPERDDDDDGFVAEMARCHQWPD